MCESGEIIIPCEIKSEACVWIWLLVVHAGGFLSVTGDDAARTYYKRLNTVCECDMM